MFRLFAPELLPGLACIVGGSLVVGNGLVGGIGNQSSLAEKGIVPPKRQGILAAIGETPLIEIPSLSRATGCRILAKMENLNPGGSVKDRVALWMVEEAERSGRLQAGGTICEGTGGNTGVGLALVAAAKGYKCILCMPAATSPEKVKSMEAFGAEVVLCPAVPFTDARHYFHVAAARAKALDNAVYTNQFNNLQNMNAHLEGTGPEIWRQSQGQVDGFVCSAGTGGTISGCSQYLKQANPAAQMFVIDPPGSALCGYVEHKLAGAPEPPTVDVHGFPTTFIPRSAGSTISEGIGIDRLTRVHIHTRLQIHIHVHVHTHTHTHTHLHIIYTRTHTSVRARNLTTYAHTRLTHIELQPGQD
jgi:cysteine synthase A